MGTLDLSVYLLILNGKIDNVNFLLRNFVSQRDILQKMIEVGNYDGITEKSELRVDWMEFDSEHMILSNNNNNVNKNLIYKNIKNYKYNYN